MIRTALIVAAAAALVVPTPAQAVPPQPCGIVACPAPPPSAGTGPVIPKVPRGSSAVCFRLDPMVPWVWQCAAWSRKTGRVTAHPTGYGALWKVRGWHCNSRTPARIVVCWKP